MKSPPFITAFRRSPVETAPASRAILALRATNHLQGVMHKHIDQTGFEAPVTRPLGHERRTVAFAELIAILALALSTVVVGTVVSVGIARANVASDIIHHDGSLFGIVLLLALIIIAFGSFTVMPRRDRIEE
jgi:hypothetical protein